MSSCMISVRQFAEFGKSYFSFLMNSVSLNFHVHQYICATNNVISKHSEFLTNDNCLWLPFWALPGKKVWESSYSEGEHLQCSTLTSAFAEFIKYDLFDVIWAYLGPY